MPLRLAACVLAWGLPTAASAQASAQTTAPTSAQTSTPTSAPTSAQPAAPAAGPPLRQAFEAAWRRSVAAREAQGRQQRADAERATTARPWAAPPALSLGLREDRLQRGSGGRELELGLAVPLWLPGQRAARAASNEAAVAQARAAEAVARLRLAGELREAAWQLAALQAEQGQALQQQQALDTLAADVARRVQAGDLAPADALAAQAEQLAAAAALSQAQQRLQAAQAGWTLLTGLPGLPALTAASEAGSAAASAPASATVHAAAPPDDTHPELQAALQNAELARSQLALLRQAGRDAPELSLGLRQETPARGAATQGSLVLGLRLPFGTDERNRPLQAAALSALDVAQLQLQRLRESLLAEQASARLALQAAQVQLQAENRRAGLLRERAALVERAFRAGETPLPELLRALAAAAQAEGAVARQHAALGLAGARLQQALGELP